MRDRLDEFGPAEIVVITFTSPGALEGYQRRFALPFPLLLDPGRRSYRAYGLRRASTRRVWNTATLRRYGEIVRRDGPGDLRRPIEDTRQLGGDFVVDRRGQLGWGYWSEGPDDRPSIDELVIAVRDASDERRR